MLKNRTAQVKCNAKLYFMNYVLYMLRLIQNSVKCGYIIVLHKNNIVCVIRKKWEIDQY